MTPSHDSSVFPEGRWMHRIFVALFALMALTGFGQMPIFKRYYIADVPGLAWTAQYYTTHFIHYLGAAVLLAFFAYLTVAWVFFLRHQFRLTPSAWLRLALLAGIVATGVMRVLKNLPDVLFSPGVTMFVDIAHLGFMLFYLVTALVCVFTKSKWMTPKNLMAADLGPGNNGMHASPGR